MPIRGRLYVDPLDLDRALGDQRSDCAERGQHRRKQRADDADGQGELDDGLLVLLDDHTADVAFVNQLLYPVDQLTALGLERLDSGLLLHDSLLVAAIFVLHPRRKHPFALRERIFRVRVPAPAAWWWHAAPCRQ